MVFPRTRSYRILQQYRVIEMEEDVDEMWEEYDLEEEEEWELLEEELEEDWEEADWEWDESLYEDEEG